MQITMSKILLAVLTLLLTISSFIVMMAYLYRADMFGAIFCFGMFMGTSYYSFTDYLYFKEYFDTIYDRIKIITEEK